MASRGGQPATGVHSAEGELAVRYMIEESPGSASGNAYQNATDIDFHPGYVVVRTKDGGGQVFFPSRTRNLTWTRQP